MGPQSKRRKLASQVEEVNFDPVARHEFLTGFRKRKQQRARHAQEVAEKRAKEEARLERKRVRTTILENGDMRCRLTPNNSQMREERTAEFQRAMKEHQEQLRKMNEENDSGDEDGNSKDESDNEEHEWEGFEEPPAVDYEEEYIDEGKYTTVTVEEMDASREGLLQSAKPEESSDEDQDQQTENTEEANHDSNASTVKKRRITKANDKPKKKKFRYESKEDRKLNQLKQRLSNKKKAAARRER